MTCPLVGTYHRVFLKYFILSLTRLHLLTFIHIFYFGNKLVSSDYVAGTVTELLTEKSEKNCFHFRWLKKDFSLLEMVMVDFESHHSILNRGYWRVFPTQ